MPYDTLCNTLSLGYCHVFSLLFFCVWKSSLSTDLIFLFNVVFFQKVTFQQHLVNTQNDFNLGLGVFTARVAGIYYFNFHSMSKVGDRTLHSSCFIQLHRRNLTSTTASCVSYSWTGIDHQCVSVFRLACVWGLFSVAVRKGSASATTTETLTRCVKCFSFWFFLGGWDVLPDSNDIGCECSMWIFF